MIEPEPRSDDARILIDRLIEVTRKSRLEQREERSIEGSLGWLRNESIRSAGKRLAASLEGQEYRGMEPGLFFDECYNLRAKLVHGYVPRSGRTEVASLSVALENFVGDLISVPFLGPRE
jgi:hypothetical protein